MPAKPLTPAQKQDAARLKKAWKAWQSREKLAGRPCTQEEVAEQLHFKTQSAVAQYLNGIIPLNLPALKKFCDLFGVSMASISPDIVNTARAEALAVLEHVSEATASPVEAVTGKPRIREADWGTQRKTSKATKRATKGGKS